MLTVLDTNVLLHYQPPDKVNWQEVVKESQIRLVLPLRVIEELDEKKYLAREQLADRARRLLSQLWSLLKDNAGAPVMLNLCRDLQSVKQLVVLVTGDTGMSLRAASYGICVVSMPERYRRIRRPSNGD